MNKIDRQAERRATRVPHRVRTSTSRTGVRFNR